MFEGGSEDSEIQQDGGGSTTSLDHVHHQATPIFMFDNKKMEKTLEFPFSYNVSTMPKVQPNDRFDQSFAYNYPTVVMGQMPAQSVGTAPATVYKCDICGAMFAHPSLLAQHRKDHAPQESQQENIVLFLCQICNASFSQSSDLKLHTLSQHTQQHTEPPPPPPQDKKKIKIDTGDNKLGRGTHNTTTQTGSQSSGQPQYQKGYFPVKKRRTTTVAKCFKCDGTGIVFVNEPDPPPKTVQKQTLDKSKLIKKQPSDKDKPFTCNICFNTFSRYSSLWSHKKLHSGEKPFKCEICDLAFARSSSLKNHTRVHTGERPYKCDTCGMQFSQAPHLKNHERIHSGEKPYGCDICSKTFSRHSTLWNHRRIHTGEKPYSCDICGAAFNQASHLKNHAKVHTGEKPYRCDICDVSFSDRFTLKRHSAIHDKSRATAQALSAQAAWKHNTIPLSSSMLPNIKQGQTTQTEMTHYN